MEKGICKGTNTITIGLETNQIQKKNQISKYKQLVYVKICCNYQLQKEDPYRVHITVGGNQIFYPEETTSPTSDIITIKCLFNSVISTKVARFETLDIKYFYLNSKLKDYEYIFIDLALIPEEIIDKYNL